MRTSCADCARKHLAQALVISHELPYYADDYYDNHLFVFIGHMAEAADQIQKDYPDIAANIRNVRLKVVEDVRETCVVDINKLIRSITEVVALKKVDVATEEEEPTNPV